MFSFLLNLIIQKGIHSFLQAENLKLKGKKDIKVSIWGFLSFVLKTSPLYLGEKRLLENFFST
jgi:hypothetical protein